MGIALAGAIAKESAPSLIEGIFQYWGMKKQAEENRRINEMQIREAEKERSWRGGESAKERRWKGQEELKARRWQSKEAGKERKYKSVATAKEGARQRGIEERDREERMEEKKFNRMFDFSTNLQRTLLQNPDASKRLMNIQLARRAA